MTHNATATRKLNLELLKWYHVTVSRQIKRTYVAKGPLRNHEVNRLSKGSRDHVFKTKEARKRDLVKAHSAGLLHRNGLRSPTSSLRVSRSYPSCLSASPYMSFTSRLYRLLSRDRPEARSRTQSMRTYVK